MFCNFFVNLCFPHFKYLYEAGTITFDLWTVSVLFHKCIDMASELENLLFVTLVCMLPSYFSD